MGAPGFNEKGTLKGSFYILKSAVLKPGNGV